MGDRKALDFHPVDNFGAESGLASRQFGKAFHKKTPGSDSPELLTKAGGVGKAAAWEKREISVLKCRGGRGGQNCGAVGAARIGIDQLQRAPQRRN